MEEVAARPLNQRGHTVRRVSRRELLATFLGASCAAAGCRDEDVPDLPPGRLVEPSRTLGHRIRDGAGELVSRAGDMADEDWQTCDVVIVGGGVAGLSAARRLLMAGCKNFVLLEMEDVPGGTARGGMLAQQACPWGAHYLPVPQKENGALVGLLGEMGVLEGVDVLGQPLGAEEHLCRDPQERLFYAGRWYDGLYLRAGATPEDRRQWAQFQQVLDGWSAWRDQHGRRAFTLPLAGCSDDPEVTQLDKMPAAQWLEQQGFNSPRLLWMVDYACRDDYGMSVSQASAWAALFYFVSRRVAPGSTGRPFLTWPEGNARIVRHLSEMAGVRVRSGEAVIDINPVVRDGREVVEVVSLVAEGADGRVRGYRANRVIMATPQFLAPYLVRPWRSERPGHVSDFEYGSWMVANLAVDQRPAGIGFPMAWDNVFYNSRSLGYVVATHQTGQDRGPTVLTYYYPIVDEAPRGGRRFLESIGRDEWADVVLADIEQAHPEIRQLTRELNVARWGHAMIRPTPGFVWSGSRESARQPWQGIHFANTDLSGVALFEEAFYHGTRAGEEVLAALSISHQSIL